MARSMVFNFMLNAAMGGNLASGARESSRALQALQNQARSLQAQLRGLNTQRTSGLINQEAFSQQTSAINTQMARMQAAQRNLVTAQSNYNTQVGNARGAWSNVGSSVLTVAAAAAPLASMVNTAMGFEAAMSKVGAISGASAEEMSILTDTAKQLGSTTQFSASQSAEAMSYLAMAGWKTNQIVGAMPGLLNLAAASGEDLATVSDILSDDMTAFGLSAEQAGHVADVFAAASSNANTNVSMLGETFKYAGPIAGALGYSLEDVSVAAGLMANASIKGSMAGTALRSIMTRLIEPPKDAANAMEALGIQVKNADGTVKPFGQTISDLREKFSQLSDAEKAKYANWLAGQEAMGGLLAVVNASDNDFLKLSGAINNCDGKAAEMAETMQNNAKGALTRLQSAMEGISISIGGALLPALADLVDKVSGIAGAFGGWATTHQGIVKMGLAVAGIGASTLIAAKSFVALTSTIEAARAGMQLLRDMRMAESVAGLAPSGGMFGNMFSGISTAFSGVLGQISTFSGLLVAKITGPFRAMGGIFRTIGGLMAENMVTPFMGRITTFFGGLSGRIMPLITRFIGPLTTMFTPLAGMLSGPLTAAFGGVITSFGGLAAAALPIAGIIAGIVAVGAILYSNWDTISNVAEIVYGKVTGCWDAAMQRLQPAFDSISQSIDKLGVTFSTFGGNSSMLEAVFNTLGAVIAGTFMAAITVVETFVVGFSGALEIITTTVNEVGVAIQAVAEGDWAAAWNSMGNIVSTVVSGIISTVGNMVSAVTSGIQSILGLGGGGGGGGGSEIASNAEGGIYRQGAFLTTFAEKSPEAAIPLDGSQRAIDLWKQAGQMLGQPIASSEGSISPLSAPNMSEQMNAISSLTGHLSDGMKGISLPAISVLEEIVPSLPKISLPGFSDMFPNISVPEEIVPSLPKISLPDFGDVFPDISGIGNLKEMLNNITTGDTSNTTNNNSSNSSNQTISINIPVTINGNADESTIGNMQNSIVDIVRKAMADIQNQQRRVSFA